MDHGHISWFNQLRHAVQQYMDHGHISWFNCKSNAKSITVIVYIKKKKKKKKKKSVELSAVCDMLVSSVDLWTVWTRSGRSPHADVHTDLRTACGSSRQGRQRAVCHLQRLLHLRQHRQLPTSPWQLHGWHCWSVCEATVRFSFLLLLFLSFLSSRPHW